MPVPSPHHVLTPYLIVDDAAGALGWYTDVFGARELMCLFGPGGKIGHAEIAIGDSRIMLADANPAMGARAPGAFGGSPVSLHLSVPDVDATMAKAIGAGAAEISAPEDKFYGDRLGTLVDPFGHTWHICTHIEDVSFEEIERRMGAMVRSGD